MIFPSNVFNVLKNREGVFKTLENWKILNLWVVINKKSGYFWHLVSRAYFQSRFSPRSCFKCLLQVREFIADPQKPIGDPRPGCKCL